MRSRFVAAWLVASFACTGLAQADQLADIRHKGEIVVGVLAGVVPNSFVDARSGEFTGYEVELARAVARKIGVKPVFKSVAVAARISELQQGNVDMLAASLTHNRQREAQIDFSLTTVVTGQRVLARAASGVEDLQDLAGKKVVVVQGGTQEANIRKAVPSVEIVAVATTQLAVQALQQGQAEAIFVKWYGPGTKTDFQKRWFTIESDSIDG